MTQEQFRYNLITGRNASFPKETSERNGVYDQWSGIWDEVYKNSGSGYELKSDEFTRQDLIGYISSGTDVSAVHLYSFFDISCHATMDMKYFDFYDNDFWTALREKNVTTVMTMEFLTVNPKYRRREIGINLGKVITQTGGYLFTELEIDAIIAPARNDLKVSDLAYDLGFSCIKANTMQRGFECDLIACFKGDIRDSSDTQVADIGRFLWNGRRISHSAQEVLVQHQRNQANRELHEESSISVAA